MGLLDFDLKKITENPAFMLGMNIHGANSGHYGQLGPALSGGINNYAQQQAMLQQQQIMKQKVAQQKAQQQWMSQYMPKYANAPSFVQQEAIKSRFKPESDRKMYKAADGYNYWVDNNERVNPNVALKPSQPLVQVGAEDAKIISQEDKLQLGLDPKVPYVWDRNNEPKPIKKTNFTDGQLQAANFANMMKTSEDMIFGLMDTGYDPSTVTQAIGAKGGDIGNLMVDPNTRQFVNAMKAWVRAKLRKESGAVIGDEEMAEEFRTYFPQVGDDAGTIAQKEQLRQQALSGMARMSGGAYEYVAPAKPKTPEKKKPTNTKVINGVTYFQQDGKWFTE